MASFTTERIETNGYTTEYLDSHGDGDVVLLLHGGGPGANAATNWRGFIPGLAHDYRVIAPDILGYGNTDHPEDGPPTLVGWMRERVRQVIALLDALGIEQAHVIGNSMGGALTMWLTEAHPERVRSLVLMGSAGGHMAAPTQEVIRMATYYKDPSKEGLKALTRWFVYDEGDLGTDLDSIVEDRFVELNRPEVRRSYTKFFNPQASLPSEMTVPQSSLRRIQQRTLLVHGREDRFVTPDSSVYLNQHIPNSQLHIFEKCGHWVQIERRDAMIALVRLFYAEGI